jgi:hypothetical protein
MLTWTMYKTVFYITENTVRASFKQQPPNNYGINKYLLRES